MVSINAEHKLSVSISDAAGRGIMIAQIEPYNGTTPNALITWSCQQYDNVVNVSGFGECLESRSIDALGNISKSRSDGAGRTLESEDADGFVSTAKYDAGRNVKQSRDPNGVGIDTVYDELGRQTETTDTHGDTTKTVYNKAGQAIEQEEAKQKKTLTVYDARSRRKTVTDRLTGVTSYDYDLNSNLTSITDAETRVTGYEYDVRNLKTKETYPDHVSGSTIGQPGYGVVEFAHDAASRVFRKTDQRGDTCTFNFDLASRMTKRDYRTAANSPSGAIADSDVYTHNNSGQTLTATTGRYNNVVTMAYDDAGRKKDESLTISGQTYTVGGQYDVRGQLWKQTYPDGKIVERLYHDDGQLHQVKYDGNLVDTRLYDDGGRLEKSTYGNGVVTDFTYFDDNNTESITIKDASQNLIDSFIYTYDANKNVTGETRGGVMSGYSWNTNNSGAPGYDDDDRLTYWKHSDSSQTQSWNLSFVGDWNNTTINGTQQNHTHNAVHELTAVESTPLTYDVKGNLTTNTSGHTYTWDFDNRLSGADTDANSVDDVLCEYDALGRRVRKNNGTTNTVYVLAGWQVIAEYAAGTVPASPSEQYVYASYIDEPILKTGTGGAVYYSRNRQYSITCMTNSTGVPVEFYTYDSHGKFVILNGLATETRPSSDYENQFTYTGRYYVPVLNLYYFRARWFDSALGRFIGRDPIGYVDGMSLYRGYFVPQGMDSDGRRFEPTPIIPPELAAWPWTKDFYRCSATEKALLLKAKTVALSRLERNARCFFGIATANAQCKVQLHGCITEALKRMRFRCADAEEGKCHEGAGAVTESACSQLKSDAANGQVFPEPNRRGDPKPCEPCEHPLDYANNCELCPQGSKITTWICRVGRAGRIVNDVDNLAELMVHEASHNCVGGHDTTLGEGKADVCRRPDAKNIEKAFRGCK